MERCLQGEYISVDRGAILRRVAVLRHWLRRGTPVEGKTRNPSSLFQGKQK